MCLNTSGHLPVFCCLPWRVYSWDHVVLLQLGRYSLNMLHGSHSHFQLLENFLCFARQHPFLIPFLVLAGAREKFWNLVSWKRLQVHFPLSFGRHCSVASSVTVERLIWSPVFHTWPVQSLETFIVFFLSLAFQNFIMIWLCGLASFFFPINCAWHLETLILWNFLNYFFENDLSPAFTFSISGPLFHYLDLSFVVYFSPVLCLCLFVLLCFCLFSDCK